MPPAVVAGTADMVLQMILARRFPGVDLSTPEKLIQAIFPGLNTALIVRRIAEFDAFMLRVDRMESGIAEIKATLNRIEPMVEGSEFIVTDVSTVVHHIESEMHGADQNRINAPAGASGEPATGGNA